MIAPSTKPPNSAYISSNFNATSSYKDNFDSRIHRELASGPQLQANTKE